MGLGGGTQQRNRCLHLEPFLQAVLCMDAVRLLFGKFYPSYLLPLFPFLYVESDSESPSCICAPAVLPFFAPSVAPIH